MTDTKSEARAVAADVKENACGTTLGDITKETTDIKYNLAFTLAKAGTYVKSFTLAKAGTYVVSFDAEVIANATVAGKVEIEAYSTVGAPSVATPKFGRIRVNNPDSTVIGALPAWPIASTALIRVAAGAVIHCVIGVTNASDAIVPGPTATPPFNVNAAEANVTILRVSA